MWDFETDELMVGYGERALTPKCSRVVPHLL
jgi:hypothetical protein